MPPTKRKEESVTVSDVFAVCKEIQANQTELSSKIPAQRVHKRSPRESPAPARLLAASDRLSVF